MRKSKALDLSLGSWASVLLLFLTEGTMCEVGALYLTLTGASGFLAAPLEDELKSLLKLGDKRKKRKKKGKERRKRETERKRGE